MKNYVFVISAKFAAGKTTVAKLLEERYGIVRAVTCTTRGMREGEREGIDYYFCDDATFENLASTGKLVAINRIKEMPIEGGFRGSKKLLSILQNLKPIKYVRKYGLPIDKIDLSKRSYLVALEPSGYYDLIKEIGKDNVKLIYLKLSDKERWLRALNREVNPDVDIIVSKYIEEKELYDGIEEKSDKVINNAGTSDNAAIETYQYIKACIGD